MSKEREPVSIGTKDQRQETATGCGFVHFWIMFAIPAFAVAGFFLAGECGIVWRILASLGGAFAAILTTPLAILVLVTVVHFGVKTEDHFKPIPAPRHLGTATPTIGRTEMANRTVRQYVYSAAAPKTYRSDSTHLEEGQPR